MLLLLLFLLLLLLLNCTWTFIPLLHLLKAIMSPRSLGGWHIDRVFLCGALVLRIRTNWSSGKESTAATTHVESTTTTAPGLPTTSPPSTQTAQVLVQQTIVMTPKLSYLGDKGRVTFKALLIGLTGGLPTRARPKRSTGRCVGGGRHWFVILFVGLLSRLWPRSRVWSGGSDRRRSGCCSTSG